MLTERRAVGDGLPAAESGAPFEIWVDGQPLLVYSGQTVATALLSEGISTFRHTAKQRSPRGVFCGIGVCFDCLVTIDGVPDQRACLATVTPGMVVETGVLR